MPQLGQAPVSIRELPGTSGKRKRRGFLSRNLACLQALARSFRIVTLWQFRRLSPASAWVSDIAQDLIGISARIRRSRNNIFVPRVQRWLWPSQVSTAIPQTGSLASVGCVVMESQATSNAFNRRDR